MEFKSHTTRALIIKAALTGAIAGAFLGVLWLAIEIPWLEPRQKETWPQWIGFVILWFPAALGGAWVGGGVASAILFLIQVSTGRMSRTLILWMLGLLTLWAIVTVIVVRKYDLIPTPASVNGQPPRAVGRQLPDEKIPEMIAALDDPSPQVRCASASSLFAVSRPASAQNGVGKLIELTKDASSCVRGASIETLGRLAPRDARVFAAAQTLLKDNDEDVKWRAANTLIANSCSSSTDIRFMDELLKSPDYSQTLKIRFVRVVGCQHENGLGILENVLSSQNEPLQKEAIFEISRIILRDPESQASLRTLEALKNLTPVSDAMRKLQRSTIHRLEMLRSRQGKEKKQ